MKKMIIAAVLMAASIYLIFSYFFDDFEVNKYADLAIAREHQAIQKGWIPAIAPASAYAIAEMHDRMTPTLYGSFRYREPDEARFLSRLTPLHDANNTRAWGAFLFRIDTETNTVKYRNKPVSRPRPAL